MSNSQLSNLKYGIKNVTEVTLNLSSNAIGDSNDMIPHKLLVTDKQVSRIPKYFANNTSANMNLSKTLLSKIVQLWEFLDRSLKLPFKN